MAKHSILLMAVALGAVGTRVAAEAPTHVPPWNARGSGLLPVQAIACVDVAGDGTIAVGTIAPAERPNVFAIDAAGRLVGRSKAGERWIGGVAATASDRVYALCTMPAGRAEDVPTVYACGPSAVEIPSQLGQADYPQIVFQYGDHGNHSGTHVRRFDDGAAALYGTRLLWLSEGEAVPAATARVPVPPEAVAVSLAVHQSGAAVAGFAAAAAGPDRPPNLFVFPRHEPQPAWSRPLVSDVDDAAAPEKGRYGTPTLPDGRREELPQEDRPLFAPLSIAVDRGPRLTRVATADYPGWQRWIRSAASGRDRNYGTRFMPARPAVTVYDANGNLVRRFDPAMFDRPMWVDLAFLPGGNKLVAYPHHWPCRGLAGQTFLPADQDARTIWLLDANGGDVRSLDLPDAVCDVAIGDDGSIAATCWDGRLYLLTEDSFGAAGVPAGVALGGPAIVAARPAAGFVIAGPAGLVRAVDAGGNALWQVDLERAVEPTTPAWITKAAAERIATGLWRLPGGRVESDLGGQYLIEAPDGLILIEGHGGLSFEREWAAIEAAGLDPRRVRYVLATHEHGDHAPGAYLWRVATGAQFVCSEEMASTLQHHVPVSTGYGLHPPVPADITIADDELLDLAGLPITAVRLPGHTFGSLGWLFALGDKRYVAIGDLVMPDGTLGYAESINFSASDVLASLRKLDRLRVDFILPGHGPITPPERYILAGIDVGRRVGWGKIRPAEPDPRFRLTQANVLVVAWNIGATAADVADFNGDCRPDIAVVTPAAEGSSVQVFLNRGGTFAADADHVIPLPGVSDPVRLRVRDLNGDDVPDFFVGGVPSALLLSQETFPAYRRVPLATAEANQARRCDWDGDGREDMLIGRMFGMFERVVRLDDGSTTSRPLVPPLGGPFCDLRPIDLNGDGRDDLVSSYGHVLLRDARGKLPAEVSQKLPPPDDRGWSFLGVGDFNDDGRPDVALASSGQGPVKIAVFQNTGRPDRPFGDSPDMTLDLDALPAAKKLRGSLLRDSMPAADFDGDDIVDVMIANGQERRLLVLLGGRAGLSLDRSLSLDLDYSLQYDACLLPADFDGDGRLDIAALGCTRTGVGSGGPPAVYVYLQAAGDERDQPPPSGR